jgi:hypothetical protein
MHLVKWEEEHVHPRKRVEHSMTGFSELARADPIESRWTSRLALRPNVPACERFYADTGRARRGNAPLRQAGSTVGPVPHFGGAATPRVVSPGKHPSESAVRRHGHERLSDSGPTRSADVHQQRRPPGLRTSAATRRLRSAPARSSCSSHQRPRRPAEAALRGRPRYRDAAMHVGGLSQVADEGGLGRPGVPPSCDAYTSTLTRRPIRLNVERLLEIHRNNPSTEADARLRFTAERRVTKRNGPLVNRRQQGHSDALAATVSARCGVPTACRPRQSSRQRGLGRLLGHEAAAETRRHSRAAGEPGDSMKSGPIGPDSRRCGRQGVLWSFVRLLAVIRRHSVRAADLPRR